MAIYMPHWGSWVPTLNINQPLRMSRDHLPPGGYHLAFLFLNIFITLFVSGTPGPFATQRDPLLQLHRCERTVHSPLLRA